MQNNQSFFVALLSMFTKVQTLDKQDVICIKNMLNVYILKTDLQKKLA